MITRTIIVCLIISFCTEIYINAQIPTNGLVAYFPFNGNANDESGNGKNGTIYGATLTFDRCGNPNSAYFFDGISNYIAIPSGDLIWLNEYSYSLWIKPAAVPTNDGGVAYYVGGMEISSGQGLTYLPETTLWGACYNIGTNPTLSASRSLPTQPNQWLHVVVTRDEIKIKMYVNGKLIKSTYTDLINNQTAYYGTGTMLATIGGKSDLNRNNFFNGAIDDVVLYNRAFDSSEVLRLYETFCTQNKILGMNPVCQGQQNVSYYIEPVDNATAYTWNYSGTGATITGNSPSVSVSFDDNATNGILSVYVTVNNIEIIKSEFPITVNPLPADAGTISGLNYVCQDQNGVTYSVPVIDYATSYFWNYTGAGAIVNSNSNLVIINFTNQASSGNLTVTGNNICGSSAQSDVFPITVDSCKTPSVELNIPNAFSPNGDGTNDLFKIKGLTENTILIIFDRSGKKLYESNNYQNNWDGLDSEGRALRSDTYWYIISVPGSQREFKGFVFLKR